MIFSWRLNVCHNSQTHLYSMVILAESAIQHTFGCCCYYYYYYCYGCYCRRRCCCWFRLNSSPFFSAVVRSVCMCFAYMLSLRVCFDCCCCFAILRSRKYVCVRTDAAVAVALLFYFYFSSRFFFEVVFFCFSSFLFILFVRVPYPIQSKPICIVCCVYTCDVGPRRCISARVLLWRCLCIFYPHIFHFDTHMYIARKRIYNTRPRHTEHYQKAEILSDRQFVVVVCAFFLPHLLHYIYFVLSFVFHNSFAPISIIFTCRLFLLLLFIAIQFTNSWLRIASNR